MLVLSLPLLAALAGPQDVRVTVRAGTETVRCVLRDGAGAPAAARLPEAGEARWSWKRLPGDVLGCSSAGLAFEAVDLDSGQDPLPAEVTLELPPARTVTLEGDWGPGDTLVEWRELPLDTGAASPARTRIRARRSLRLAGRVAVAVASEPRVLRLWPPGASPVSLFVPPGDAPLTLRLPERRPGGELFGRLPAHAFTPQALELTAGRHRVIAAPDSWRVFRAGGLSPGAYNLVPRYQGGVRGEARPLVIRAGQSLELLPLTLPEPGAVSFSVGDEVCDREHLPVRLALRKVVDDPPTSRPFVEETIAAAPCQRELEGFEEGLYEAQLVRARPGEGVEILASARWDAVRGQRAAVVLIAPEVRVSGRLTFGEDRPAAGLVLVFGREGQRWSAPAGEDGEFALSLGTAGDYEISVLTPAGAHAASFSRRLDAGAQRADFKLPEAAIDVRLSRSDAAPLTEPVQVAAISKTGARLEARWSPGVEPELRFEGVAFGEYWVTGTTDRLASGSELRVALTPETPLAEVEVVLEQRDGRLTVVDELGMPVADPEVSAGERLLSPADGGFRLRGVAVGERLLVRAPGYVPVCRILQPPDLPEVRVALARPTDSLTLHVAHELDWEAGGLLGLPGSNCAVEVTRLEFDQRPRPDRNTVVLRLPRGRFELVLGSNSYPAVVPGNDIVVLDSGSREPAR